MLKDVKKVDYFLLRDEWREPDASGRICYSVRTSGSKEEHNAVVEEERQKLLDENDEDYTSWVHTGTIYGEIGGIQPHCSIMHFRVRDAY